MTHPSAANIIDLYERHSMEFDRERGKNLFERDWLDSFLGITGPGAEILDLGCGSGEPIARYFIESGHRVTGIDASPRLISLCQQRFPGNTWSNADMRRLDLGRQFAGILAWDSFFHLPHEDQRAMFPVFRSHAFPGTALMFTSGYLHGEAIGEYHGEDLYHASLDTEEYNTLLQQHDFKVLRHQVNDPGCGNHTVWLAECL